MSIANKAIARVNRMRRGEPFSIGGFYSLGTHTAVQKAMSRMVKQGSIERVSKGFYVRPKSLASIPSITLTTNTEQIAKVWAKENGYALASQGLEAAYRLGFQTQAPMKTILWSNGPSREFAVGNEVVKVRHTTIQKLRWIGRPEGELLRGISVTPPESIELKTLTLAFKRLSLSGTEAKVVIHKLKKLTISQAWMNKLTELEEFMTHAHI